MVAQKKFNIMSTIYRVVTFNSSQEIMTYIKITSLKPSPH